MGHHHDNKEKINRINRIIGHANSIKTMLEEDRECDQILIQIAAVKSALNNLGKLVLKDHIDHCLVEAINNNDEETLENLSKAIDKLI